MDGHILYFYNVEGGNQVKYKITSFERKSIIISIQ